MVSKLVAVMLLVMLGWLVIPGSAMCAVSCNPQGYSSIIGQEVVAVDCIPENMNDDWPIRYKYRDYECISGKVTKTAEGNIVQVTPNAIMYPSNGMGSQFRHFRNKEGSYFFQVSKYYRGTIDGKSMNSYPAGGVYTDIFTDIFEQTPISTPKCKGGDYNTSGCGVNSTEKPAGSTVNLGTGRLSHDQELFTLSGSNSLSPSVSLYYRSLPFAPSAIGNGWSHSYEATLVAGSGGSMVFWDEGKRTVYNKYTTVYVPPKGDTSSLVKNADTSWTITERNGLKRNFDPTGKLTSIVDRFGNTLTFSYDSGKLTSVSDGKGRSITFGYKADGKLETVTDPKGSNSFIFTYTSDKLTSVTPPGSSEQWL